MIAPQLATMISVITTDAVLSSADLKEALDFAVAHSFNAIDADGCMSTNDTVILMSSGESGETPDLETFKQKLLDVTKSLANQMISDTEGATHNIEIRVVNAQNYDAALAVARSIARSNLFKCAIFGNDPNWGRILASAGVVPESVAAFDGEDLDVSINGVWVCKNSGIGEPREFVNLNDNRDVVVVVDLKVGTESATVLTNDLTYDYVKENAEYSS
jgi:glutamate N-acetyltransferase/amino-acid N-acetyltransferase